MTEKVIVVSPHPDDETLGCGGTLLKHIAQGDIVEWLNVTSISEELGFSKENILRRQEEIRMVAEEYAFFNHYQLCLPTMKLDTLAMDDIVNRIGEIFKKTEPTVVYIPYPGDVHTDHRAVFDAAVSCTKWFRYPSIKKVLVYETLSETEFGLNPDHNGFRPNVFVDITDFLEKKIQIMGIYKSEFGAHPFPRSPEAIRGLAQFRGAAAGCTYAESFMLLKERL